MSSTFWRLLEQAVDKVKESPNGEVYIIDHSDGTYELTTDTESVLRSQKLHESHFILHWEAEEKTFSTGRYHPALGRTVWHDKDEMTEIEFREEIEEQRRGSFSKEATHD